MILENESYPDDTRVYLEATGLQRVGFRVTVICPTGNSSKRFDELEGVRVYRYPKPLEFPGVLGYVLEFGYSMLVAFALASWVLVRHGFDAIHVHCPPDMNTLVALPFKLIGKKFVVDLHDLSPELYQAQNEGHGNALINRLLHGFERLACKTATALISTNSTQRDVQIERGGAAPERCFVVRNGPHDMFQPDLAPMPGIRPTGTIVIGYVGVIGIQDGVEKFVEVLAELRKSRPEIKGVIVGSGPAISTLHQLADELGVTDSIQFTGFVDFTEVPRYIAAFDVCVTPDPSNPYNDSCTTIKTMEYMAMRRPTVAFDTKENRITAGRAALYASDNNVPEMADLIKQIIDDPQLSAEMGQFGREKIENSLAWSHQEHILVSLYVSLLGGNKEQSTAPDPSGTLTPQSTCHSDVVASTNSS